MTKSIVRWTMKTALTGLAFWICGAFVWVCANDPRGAAHSTLAVLGAVAVGIAVGLAIITAGYAYEWAGRAQRSG